MAIIDLTSRANQPLLSEDRRHAIVFNGEIYNFRELRTTLEQQGVVFRTTSDTEVLLALYARDGAEMLPRLRGMFAIAVWDTASRELFLARDPYGIKPLYYAPVKEGVVFASQVKAIVASQLAPVEPEPAGVAGFHLWGNVPEPWTLYRNLLTLPAGHYLRVRGGLPGTPVCWYDIRAHWRARNIEVTTDDIGVRVREALMDSVRAHLVSDVPVSVFLSGGVDSAVLAALATDLGAPLEGITLGFEEFARRPEDEVAAAARTAAHYGMSHYERRVSAAEFAQEASRILAAMDQPSVDGINTWFASKAAAERGHKVVLSGVGGDELFCGYSSFTRVPRAAAFGRVARAYGSTLALAKALAHVGGRLIHPKLAAIASLSGSIEGAYFLSRGLFLPEELPALIGEDMARDGLARLGDSPLGIAHADACDAASAVGLLESTWYLRNQLLRDSDWASMDHSLELRTPLVDTQLLAELGPFVSMFKGGSGKALMAQSPRTQLPAHVVRRRKTGFALPMARWLSKSLDSRAGLWRNGRPHGESWARHWAAIVMADAMPCA